MAEVEHADAPHSHSGHLARAKYFGIYVMELELMQFLPPRGKTRTLDRVIVYSCAIRALRLIGWAQSSEEGWLLSGLPKRLCVCELG